MKRTCCFAVILCCLLFSSGAVRAADVLVPGELKKLVTEQTLFFISVRTQERMAVFFSKKGWFGLKRPRKGLVHGKYSLSGNQLCLTFGPRKQCGFIEKRKKGFMWMDPYQNLPISRIPHVLTGNEVWRVG